MVQNGATDMVLNWLKSYIYPRDCVISVNSAVSKPIYLPFSVPQGSVTGPVLFNCCANTLAESIFHVSSCRQQVDVIGYADDHSFYMDFRYGNTAEEQHAVSVQQHTSFSVKTWVTENKLRMNDNKTEVILFIHSSILQD